VARLQPALQAVARDVAIRTDVRILAIGSSSTAGVGASSPSLTYPRQLEAALERRFAGVEVDVENAGVSGETADATVSRLEKALQRVDKPDLVIWQVGTNDAIQAADEGRFQALLERGSAAAKRAGVGLILLDQQYYPSISDLAGYERYVHIVETVATNAGVGLFSRYRMMKEWDALGRGFLESMLSKDQFHMSDQGYQCMAQAFGREIASTVAALQRHVSSDVALGF
jgi:acyl-CoA thioesterase-1